MQAHRIRPWRALPQSAAMVLMFLLLDRHGASSRDSREKARAVPRPGFFSLWVRGYQPRTHPAPYFERDTSTILRTSIAKAIISVGTPTMSAVNTSYLIWITSPDGRIAAPQMCSGADRQGES